MMHLIVIIHDKQDAIGGNENDLDDFDSDP